jgi:polysaccharide export outer membrane protein
VRTNARWRNAKRHTIAGLGVMMFLLIPPGRSAIRLADAASQGPPEKTGAREGEAKRTRAGGESAPPNVLIEGEEDYRIGPGDVLEVQIEDAPELSGTFRVTAAGTFLMHYLGRITAHQKTTEEVTRIIADGLRGRYLNNPIVTVVVRQYNSRSFFIHGAVRIPGVYQIEGRPSLLKLLTIAGGLADNHGSTAFIIRELKPSAGARETGSQEREQKVSSLSPEADAGHSGEAGSEARYELRKANVNMLLKGRFEQDMFLEPGDIVNIPPTEVFFVAGEVNAPGSFPLKEGTTLRQAISLAQGTTFKAAAGHGLIFREDPNTGKRREIAVDISAVMRGKSEDLTIFANDVIIVPNSRLKTAAAPLLSAFGLGVVRLPIRY